MHKANHVIGLPVIDLHAGQELGVIRDVLFDEDWKFKGLLVEIKGFFRRNRFLPSDSIYAIGDDCVTVPHVDAVCPLQETVRLFGMDSGPVRMKGKPLITANGQRLGQVEDVYFQEELGTIVGYELSDGLISDLLDGRRVVKGSDRVKIGEDAIVIPVPDEYAAVDSTNLTEGKDRRCEAEQDGL